MNKQLGSSRSKGLFENAGNAGGGDMIHASPRPEFLASPHGVGLVNVHGANSAPRPSGSKMSNTKNASAYL